MTVRSGEVTKSEGSDIIQDMDIDPIELFRALTDEEKDRVVEKFNDAREDWNGDHIESVEDLPEFARNMWREWITFRRAERLAIEALDNREQEYVHVKESSGIGGDFHTIVEL